ncbi:MAG TPA: methyltransferase domain-containing protein [Thermoanaerobaculia bacterium]|nr:methyltransferase domain-containing protein [Thermoanaerobaculia bacterium]
MALMAVERAVRERYRQGAQERVGDLCCPVSYDPRYLEVIPKEVLERDYGCGDPSRHLKEGETVLDLGSGTGKICFIAAQVVGPRGRVIGVDMTDEMLQVARDSAPVVAERLGYANVEFRRGRIQDLALDIDLLDETLAREPVTSTEALLRAAARADELRRSRPLIAGDSIDVVVSNCVLNLVAGDEKPRLFQEIYRVLRSGGRAVISDIACDEPVPAELRQDPELWSGCIAGAMTESGFLEAFEEAGFHGIRILERQREPWRTVAGIEFRSVTVEAFKGKQGPCLERRQAVIYKGPFREVLDDDGHRMRRGERYAVCGKTFRLYQREPYGSCFELIEPLEEVPLAAAQPFDCSRTALRHPRETKGRDYEATTEAKPCWSRGAVAEGAAMNASGVPKVSLRSLDTLWFQVGGTLCNLACTHCFVSCSPTNHTHEFIGLAEVERYLEEAVALGVREYYFTGGEPFLNPEMEAILRATLAAGPASVLTNGLLLDPDRCGRLAAMAGESDYSLDLRISLDGYDAATNDPIRGDGTFERILAGVRNLAAAGIDPVITVTEVCAEAATASGKERFLEMLREMGLAHPRLKVLPVFRIGAEAERGGAYESWQRLRGDEVPEGAWDHLQCSTCRMVTDQGVWVCPILVNEPSGKMGETLADTLGSFPLEHPACWTCHVFGVSCRT